MASKELIALVAEAIIDNPPIETMTDDEIIIDWSPTAKAAISTILAALQEPTEGMLKEAHKAENESAVHNYGSLPSATDYWDFMLNASPLGEQSE
ncbi:hypothetical protein [Brucella pseudogrignonensis]|uniref:Uncharacterized protein n=1 Tax=Brucella pseudogrignonensis TaxID=419475 RepID=A0A256GF36_9HYPH|nr:hypothetical protein [Brucella pseudogrignonensis]OYR25757.1 hypothetical protein CEV34_2638 [Brucella pseudogrignonensis]